MVKVHNLVDSDAKVSVLSANSNDRPYEPVFNLQAANGKLIAIYGKRYVQLDMCLHKPFVADVSMPNTGIDLLQHHNLLTDARNRT